MIRTLLRTVIVILCVTPGLAAQTDRKITDSDELRSTEVSTFCSLMINETFEDAESYVREKGVEMVDIYEDIRCGNFKVSLLSYLIKETHVRSFLMYRRFLLDTVSDAEFVKMINTKAQFSSVSILCPLEVIDQLLIAAPNSDSTLKIQSLLVSYGAVRDC
jgi:hypothetical protein